MKAKTLLMAVVIIAVLLFVDMAHAALVTRAEIHLSIMVVSALSLNLETETLSQNLQRPEAEAFSELKEKGILVDKLRKGETTMWLFTKTE